MKPLKCYNEALFDGGFLHGLSLEIVEVTVHAHALQQSKAERECIRFNVVDLGSDFLIL
jgi:hypothetical protein